MTGAPSEDEALSGGPYLLVAFHEDDVDRVQLNLTSLINEWTTHLDPVGELARSPEQEWFDTDWVTRGHFVVPSSYVLALIQEGARNERLVARFALASGVLHLGDLPDWTFNLNRLIDRDGDVERLDTLAMPVLLALAVSCAMTYPIGMKGQEALKRWYEGQPASADEGGGDPES